MLGHGTSGSHTPSSYPLRCLLFMTPPVVLAAAAIYAWRGRRFPTRDKLVWALLLIWTALPLVRVSMPGAGFYDANRHFIEYVPGLCAMAGAGADWAIDALGKWRPARARVVTAATFVGLGIALVWPVAETHPFETTYFNALVGGLGGAERMGVLSAAPPLERASGAEGDYWYNSLRDGLAAMRTMLRPGQTLSACGPWPAQVQANWDFAEPLPYVGDVRGHIEEATLSADLLYAVPREGPSSSWQRIRELERTRPILRRVMRGGGLVYEVFGRPDGHRHPAVSPPTTYDPSPADAPEPPPPAASSAAPAKGPPR
jgi:hypothetical protein